MPAHRYEVAETLSGHTSSISVVLFSPDGEYLASGSENGTILITSTGSWQNNKKLVNVSSVTALLWDPTFPMTIVCGFASGAILTVQIGEDDPVRLELMATILVQAIILTLQTGHTGTYSLGRYVRRSHSLYLYRQPWPDVGDWPWM